jgi:hypothetical protein
MLGRNEGEKQGAGRGTTLAGPGWKQTDKRPKHEKFEAGIFTQVRPVWICKLETTPKTLKI